MGLLILGAVVIAVGIVLLIGLLVMTEELFSESIFGTPDESGEVTQRQSMREEQSPFSSSTRIG
jgi:hypothetical protein